MQQSTSFFRGVSDTGFIVKTIKAYGENKELNPENSKPLILHSLYEIPFNGSEATKIIGFSENQKFEEHDDNHIYFLNNNNNTVTLSKIHTQTQEETLLNDLSNLALTFEKDTDIFNSIYISGFLSNHVLINHVDKNSASITETNEPDMRQFAINKENGDIKQVKLFNTVNYRKVPITILDTFNNNLLVHSEVKEMQDPVSLDTEQSFIISILSEEDYLNSLPNYQEFDTVKHHTIKIPGPKKPN